jgi:plastocyanin
MMTKQFRSTLIVASVVIGMVLGSHTEVARAQNTATQPAATQPADTQPEATTRPAAATQPTFDLHGHVSIESGWSLQPPDLTRVVVYLAADPLLDSLSPPQGHAMVAQRHKMFVPNFVVVQLGTTVEFPNFDDFEHNVFSFSKAAPAFDLDRYPRGKSKSRVFDKVGIVQLFCNIHPSMRAIVVVTPNSFFARADATGAIVIHGVPAGSFHVVAWQERCGNQTADVTVDAEGHASDLSIVLHANRRSIVASEAPPSDGGYGVERGLGVKREPLNAPVVGGVHDAIDPEPKN